MVSGLLSTGADISLLGVIPTPTLAFLTTKLGAILGDDVKTGVNVLLMPSVKVGNACWVGPYIMVERDLPPNTIALLQQRANLSQRKVDS